MNIYLLSKIKQKGDIKMSENKKVFDEIKRLKLPVIIWGNGEIAEGAFSVLAENEILVAGRVVNILPEITDDKILTIRSLNQDFEAYIIIKAFLQAIPMDHKSVKDIFGEKCVGSYSLAELYPYGVDKIDMDHCKRYHKEFAEVYDALSDNISKESFKAYLGSKIKEDNSYLFPYVTTPQYFFKMNGGGGGPCDKMRYYLTQEHMMVTA